MSKEYVFWFQVTKKYAYYFFWNIPKKLVRVVVSDSEISSDKPIWINSQDQLSIPLPNIADIKLSISSTGNIGSVEITTQELVHYDLVPTNPLAPTLISHSNVDEIEAFINVVEALKANRIPELNENPYIRQFKKDDKPAYLGKMKDFPWDKNVSPWEYYYKFVPASVDKKERLTVRIWAIIILGSLSILTLLALYAIFEQFIKNGFRSFF